jgi:site-specific DNA-methyltransferase (adenine-specific)
MDNHQSLNKIIQGDCLEVMRGMADNSVDLTVTSPPYDNLRDYKGYSFDFEGIAEQLFRITKQGGVVVWVVGDATVDGSETCTSARQKLFFKEIGFNVHDTMIYQKSGFAFPSIDKYHQIFEYMFVFSKGKPKTFNPIKDRLNIYKKMGGDAKRQKSGEVVKGNRGGQKQEKYGQRFNIWRFKTGGGLMSDFKEAAKHPAVFPERLAIDHIKSWSNEGDVVLDCFSGSGTTVASAEKLARNYIGIEISEEYCEIARKRVQEAKDSMGLFKETT